MNRCCRYPEYQGYWKNRLGVMHKIRICCRSYPYRSRRTKGTVLKAYRYMSRSLRALHRQFRSSIYKVIRTHIGHILGPPELNHNTCSGVSILSVHMKTRSRWYKPACNKERR